jgi:hypothetical protein
MAKRSKFLEVARRTLCPSNYLGPVVRSPFSLNGG